MTDEQNLDLAYSQALWYAWGHYDAVSGTDLLPYLLLDHGWRFADERRETRRKFQTHETHFMSSMQVDWADFLISITPVTP